MDKHLSMQSMLREFTSGVPSSMYSRIRSAIEAILNYGIRFQDVDKDKDQEGFTCRAMLPDNTYYKVDVSYREDDKTKLELIVQSETTHRTHTIHKVPILKLDAAIEKAIIKLGGKFPEKEEAEGGSEDDLEDTSDSSEALGTWETFSAATQLQVGLRKITCASGYDIELTAIGGAKNIQGIDPCDIVASIVGDNDFADTIPEEGQTYQVILVDDGAQVETIEAVDNQVTRISVIGMLAGLMDYLQDIHWNVHGEVFDHLHQASDGFHWDIRSAIDRLAEQEVMCNGAMPPMSEIRQTLPRPISFDGDALLQHFRDTVNTVASHLLMLAAVSEDSTRMMLSGIANSFAAEVDYRLTRRYDLGRVDAVPICQ